VSQLTPSAPPNTLGFDACVDCSPLYGAFKSQLGVDFVMRYAVPGAANAWKTITPKEATTCAILKVAVAPIWESAAERSLDGASAGAADALSMLPALQSVGLFAGVGVVAYPTSDFDSTSAQYAALSAYYGAFKASLGSGFGVGAYANGYSANRLFADGIVSVRWITQSTGFLGTPEALAAGQFEIAQRLPTDVSLNGATINVDPDSLKSPTVDVGARIPWSGAVVPGAPFNAASIQALLNLAGQSPALGVDDVSGALTRAALATWLAKNSFKSLEWGGAAEALLDQAKVQIFRPQAAA
jgi:hypothetical protein